jgi:hypothetical protein
MMCMYMYMYAKQTFIVHRAPCIDTVWCDFFYSLLVFSDSFDKHQLVNCMM